MTKEWSRACIEMSRDINAVVRALFDRGVKHITVKDFHRTGYNLLPELIDPRARLVPGYRQGGVPGIGDPGDTKTLIFIGMHAASGSEGFLAHTLTSRIERLEVNGRLMSEVELFSSALAPYGFRPIFFSGCPVACTQARNVISGIDTYPIEKSSCFEKFNLDLWRDGLSRAVVESLNNLSTESLSLVGPFSAVITMRDGEVAARKIARRWGFNQRGGMIFLESSDILNIYSDLIKMCYLTPLIEKILPFALLLYNIWGKIGLGWVRRQHKII